MQQALDDNEVVQTNSYVSFKELDYGLHHL